MATDADTIHTASMWLELHGANAVTQARRMAVAAQSKADLDGADNWLKIIAAIEEIQRSLASP